MMGKQQIVVFSDLDGTLLDHYTYSWEKAQEALTQLQQLKIPLILCTSKTREESIHYRAMLGIDDPFIVENGAAVFVPMGYFTSFVSSVFEHGYEVIELGTPYAKIREILKQAVQEVGLHVLGFGDLTEEQLVEKTGLDFHQAAMALRRSYSEPFWFEDEKSEKKLPLLREFVQKQGLSLTKGGRFYHLQGNHHKGAAVNRVVDLFRSDGMDDLVTVGIGDSRNDISMLQAVQVPCLVKNAKGKYDPDVIEAVSPRLADGEGPEGWNNIILALLKEYGKLET